MRKRSLITASLWVLCLGFLLSTVPIIGRTRVEIPFTNPSGYSGNVVLSFPERVFAGDRTRISATISQLDVENLLDIVRLTGRLEAGFDEHITKPADVNDMLQRLRDLADGGGRIS